MKFSKFWAKQTSVATNPDGFEYALSSWSGSDISMEDAQRKSADKIDRLIQRLTTGTALERYPYADTDDIREELVQELFDKNGSLIAAVTRNQYGALVLNSASILFADVDVEPDYLISKYTWKKIIKWFRKSNESVAEPLTAKEIQLNQFSEFQKNNPYLAIRVYETAAGFRVVILNKEFDPIGAEALDILQQLNSDELYVRLCRSQKCFRARLTPKPWRMDCAKAPYRYPRTEEHQQQSHEEWVNSYNRKAANFSVCNSVEGFMSNETSEMANTILKIHDDYVFNPSSNTLA